MGIRVKTQIEGMKTEVDKGMKRIDLFLKRIQEEREIEERTLKRDAIDINKVEEFWMWKFERWWNYECWGFLKVENWLEIVEIFVVGLIVLLIWFI